MPRVAAKNRQYKVSDFSLWLEKKRIQNKMKKYEMADIINESPQNYSHKYTTGYWTYDDVLAYIHFFKCDKEEIIKLMTYN